MRIPYKHGAHLSLLIKDILHNTQIDIPLQRPRKQRSIPQYRYRHSQIKDIPIDHRDKVIVLAHDAVGYIVRVHTLFTKQAMTVAGVARGVGIRVAEFHDALHDFLPTDGLDIDVLDFEEVMVEVLEFAETLDVKDVLEEFDYPE